MTSCFATGRREENSKDKNPRESRKVGDIVVGAGVVGMGVGNDVGGFVGWGVGATVVGTWVGARVVGMGVGPCKVGFIEMVGFMEMVGL